jgi:predicted AAA+ superfamily ATPase
MPIRFQLQDHETIMQYLKLVYSDILEYDILSRKAIRNITSIKDIYLYLLNNTGRRISNINIFNYLKSSQNNSVSINTISDSIG